MNKMVLNPYLPLWEYVPDGEPHVFGDRLYIYGSHDRSHGTSFCMDDYVCWSAPLSDISDFRCEGIIWKKTDDPDNRNPIGYLYAPDVALGPDGRYYLYYFYCAGISRPLSIGVAVSDTPAGKYQYYGKVQLPFDEYLCFDPGVFVDDDKRVWLYYGSAYQGAKDFFKIKGGAVVELASDMITVISEPKLTVPNISHCLGSGYGNHAFFEASSMRKIKGKYYFLYSSVLSNELCYATSDKPDGLFEYGGTIISNGDIGYKGNKKAMAQLGNNHGSLVEINNEWYVFYHRHTMGTSFSRQGCAEKIEIAQDGTISQVEITSCGLNNGPLAANGYYSAGYCCNLISVKKSKMKIDEAIEEGNTISFVSGMSNRDTIGYKYFSISESKVLTIFWRVSLSAVGEIAAMNPRGVVAKGEIEVRTSMDADAIAKVSVFDCAGDWQQVSVSLNEIGEALPIFITYRGSNSIDVKGIRFSLR